tara:strand:+ start:108 stop:896 length:789 start_codon:yes stop_codon:yes gene_type:complete
MAIKIKYNDPKSTDFGPSDIVINVREGTIFYKSEKGIFKLQGDNLNSSEDILNINGSISASRGFFSTPGLGALRLETGEGIYKFKIGPIATVEVAGHIIPSSSNAPAYDLGSPTNPWKKLFVSDDSIHFIKTLLGVGGSRIGTTFIIGGYRKETIKGAEEKLTLDNVTNLKAGKTITTSSFDLGEGDTNKFNIVRPEAIMHPLDDSTYQKYTIEGRVGQFVGGTLFFDQNRSGDNNYIALGATDTQIRITGTITASIDGGSF